MISTDLAGVGKALAKINKKIEKMEDIATTRTLNKILLQQRTEIAQDVSKEYGVLIGSAKKHIKPVKATKTNKEVKLIASSTRSNLVSPNKIKGGISFVKKGGVRVKLKTNVRGGSKPFTIKAKAGGQVGGDDIKVRGGTKKVPVYVSKAFNKFKDITKRKVTTMKGSSIARMVGDMKIKSKDLKRAINKKFPKIYKKELVNAKHTGRFQDEII